MRVQGKSYTEISRGLGMSKSTLSTWFRHLELPEETKQKIQSKARAASINALLKINKQQTHFAEERVKTARSKAQKSITKLSQRELLLVGISLYWTGGYKRPVFHQGKARTYHPISFTSADPQKVKIFLRFLREVCGVPEEKVVVDIRINNNQNEPHLLEFWRKTTNLPFSSFKKSYRSNRSFPYGTVQIRVNETTLFHTIMGWIEGMQNV